MPPLIEAVISWVRSHIWRPTPQWYEPLPPINREPVSWWKNRIPTEIEEGGGASDGETAEHIETTPEPVAHREPTGSGLRNREAAADRGEFYFREAILDQLDHYFVCLRRMRKADPDSYALYRQIGAHVIPFSSLMSIYKEHHDEHVSTLSPWWRKTRPGFGAVGYALDPIVLKHEKSDANGKGGWIYPRLMYFHKFDPSKVPSHVQRLCPEGSSTYIMTVYWDKPGDPYHEKHGGACTEYAVHMHADGSLQLLLSLYRRPIHMKSKRKPPPGETRDFTIPQNKWMIDPFFVEWAKEHKTDPTYFLLRLFCEAAHSWERAQGMVRVDVTKDIMHAVFSVNVKRTPYFFKDRDVTVNEEGKKRRIFHIVRPHKRHLLSRDTFVKMHFRGERKFTWNGYGISITVPGRDHIDIAEFDVASVDKNAMPLDEQEGMHTMGQMGRWLRRIVEKRA